VSGITAYDTNPCLKYNGTVYAGSGDELTLKFAHYYVGNTIHYNMGEAQDHVAILGNDTKGYSLTMPAYNLVLGIEYSGSTPVNLPGKGTQNEPYEIGDNRAWNYIASEVDRGNQNLISAYYKLTADISVTTMMGRRDTYRFKGHFDGNHHKLTVSYNTSEQYTAPFRYVENADIHDLYVDGTITTSEKFAGGLIANSKGATVTNCLVSVSMTSTIDGDGTHGGLVANNVGGTLNITGSAFDGYMLGGKTNSCGGLVGWNENIVNITNCLFIPNGTAMVIDKTFVRSRSYDNVNITGSYCNTGYNNDQNTRIYRITAGDNVSITYDATSTESYSVSGITYYATGLKFDERLYAKNNDVLSLTLGLTAAPGEVYSHSGFATTQGTLSAPAQEDGPYTLTMSNADATIYATYTVNSIEWRHNGSGLENDPYIIDSEDAWNDFASYVSVGMGNYATAYYRLDADITVTTMVGNSDYKFRGHFNGNNHKLTINYGTSDAPFNENYCAPFRFISGVTIHDLHVDGTIHMGSKFAAGIAGHATGTNTIADCRVSTSIICHNISDGTHGGLVANIQGGTTTIQRCAFDGSFVGANDKDNLVDSCGGFVGWTENLNAASVSFYTCLFAPSQISANIAGCVTFSRTRPYQYHAPTINLSDCYYTKPLGTAYGKQVLATPPGGFPYKESTIAGVNYYVINELISNITVSDITATGATIGWTGSSEDAQVRYRPRESETTLFATSFDNSLPEGWTVIDADGDGYQWGHDNDEGYLYSESYNNDFGELRPDNWLVTNKMTMGTTLRLWMKGLIPNEHEEHFAIYFSNTGNTVDDFTVTLLPETEVSSAWQEFTVDLTPYAGQEGYIAIRHFNCEDQYQLVLDDFTITSVSNPQWTTVQGGDDGVTLTGLDANTTYEYQLFYTYDENTYNTAIANFTTLDDMTLPEELAVSTVTSNTATVSWKGYAPSYNLQYRKNSGTAMVTLNVPTDVWGDNTGYQMLLDNTHTAYGSIDDLDTDKKAEVYAKFGYKIPENADHTTTYIVFENSKSITIPAGLYDWCITNPDPDGSIYIAGNSGNVNGREDDFIFEAGKHYTFTVSMKTNEQVDLTVEDMDNNDAPSTQPEEWTTVNDIAATSYTLSNLDALTFYLVKVQAVKGEETSDWSDAIFTTADDNSIGLLNDADNSGIISTNNNKQCDVTLVGRTLYRDGSWNTLCLPFSLTLAGSPLVGGTAKTLNTVASNLADGALTLNFSDALETIPAGTPFIIKWDDDGTSSIENPVFQGVTVSTATSNATIEDVLTFTGTFAPKVISSGGDNTVLYLGADNTLYYPTGAMNIGSQRAYFQLLGGLTAGTTGSAVRSFTLNFGSDGTTQGVATTLSDWREAGDETFFMLDGRRLSGKPTKRGLYIVNGQKVYVK
jgi:hypothetical protein